MEEDGEEDDEQMWQYLVGDPSKPLVIPSSSASTLVHDDETPSLNSPSDGSSPVHDDSKTPALNPPSSLLYSPEKPKLTLHQIAKLESICMLALSCTPISKLPPSLMLLFQNTRSDQFRLASLKSKPYIHEFLLKLLDKENDDSRRIALEIWSLQDQVLTSHPEDEQLLKCISLALTDFWGTCSQPGRLNHERAFFVDQVTPMFRYLGAQTKLVFGRCEDAIIAHKQRQITPNVWLNKTATCFADGVGCMDDKEKIIMESSSSFQSEDIEHTLGDTMKLIGLMTSTLHMDICSNLDCSYEDILELSVLGVQVIKDRITLLKTIIDRDGDKYQVLELRSAKIPTTWENRIELMNLYDVLVCCYYEIINQRALETKLMRQRSHVVHIGENQTVRAITRNARLLQTSL